MSFQQLFMESKGQPIFCKGKELKMIDRIPLSSDKMSLRVEFISINSTWKQGVVFQTKGEFEVDKRRFSNKIVLWEHTAPKRVEMMVKSKDKVLFVYNVWDTGDGTMHYWHNGGALFIEQLDGWIVYHCNDGHPDDDFEDLIFKIKCE